MVRELDYNLPVEVYVRPKGIRMLGAKLVDTSTELNHGISAESGELRCDFMWYQRLVGKLVYLRITCPDMSFGVGCLLPFSHVIENGFTYLTSSHANITYASVKHVKNITMFVKVIIFMSK